MRSTLFSLVISMAALVAVIVLVSTGPAEGATIVVPDDYSSIQDAIDNASAGDTIRVHAGVYSEDVLVNITVTIMGNGTSNTTIGGSGINKLYISAANVNVSNLRVTGGVSSGVAIGIKNGCTIENVVANDTGVHGFHITASSNTVIRNCTMSNNSVNGMYLSGPLTDVRVTGCRFNANGQRGIHAVGTLSNTAIDNSSCTGNGDYGMVIDVARHLRVIDSTADQNNGHGLRMYGCHNLSIINCSFSRNTVDHGILLEDLNHNNTFRGCIADGNAKNGMYAYRDADTLFIDCEFKNNSGWGLRWDGVIGLNMTDCTVSGNAYRPMYVSSSTACTYANNTFHGAGGIGMGASHNNTIRGCTFNSTSLTEAAILLRDGSDNCTITDCEVVMSYNGIYGRNSGDVAINGCTILADRDGVNLQYTSGWSIRDCTIYANWTGAYLPNSDNWTFADNTITSDFGRGVVSNTCSDSIVRMNTITSLRTGLYLHIGYNVIIEGNQVTVSMDPQYAFHLIDIHRSSITGNWISSTHANIYLASCTHNIIQDNYLAPSYTGMSVPAFSEHNTITNNWVQECRQPFSIFGSFNEIYHNTIIVNLTHGLLSNLFGSSQMDSGYPGGGNFWSDYTGEDWLSGSNQDILGADGIGDTPRAVNGGSDRYPLMAPFGNSFMPNVTGEVLITSHRDGDAVSGKEVVEAVVTIGFVKGVRFYIDDVEMSLDSTEPYLFIMDTRAMAEDVDIEVKAEAIPRYSAVSVNHTITLTVNNQVRTGSWLSVSTTRNEYHPDQMVSGTVALASPPTAGTVRLVTTYNGPSGDPVPISDAMFPLRIGYGVTFWLPSDAPNGTYRLDATAYGLSGEVILWKTTASTTFNVTGSGKHEQLESLLQNLTALYDDNSAKLSTIISDLARVEANLSGKVDGMNASLRASFTVALTQLMDRLDAMDTSMSDMMGSMWADLNASSDADLQRILDAMAAMWSGINGTARDGFGQLLVSLGDSEDNITAELGLLQSYLDGEIDLSEAEVRARVDALWDDLNGTFDALDDALAARLMELEGNMSEGSAALRDYIALRSAQLELYVELANASLHYHMDAIEDAIDDYRDEVRGDLVGVSDYLEGMEANSSSRNEDVIYALSALDTLVRDLDDATMAETRSLLGDLQAALSALNTTEGDRHAATVAALISELDDVEDGLEARINATDESLAALEKLDTILAELEQVDEGIETTQEDVGEGDAGLRGLSFVLLSLLLVMVILALLMFLKMRGMEARMRELERSVTEESYED